jgi:putative ABC transport system substrate-binding protein
MFGMRRREFMILVGGGAAASVISPSPLGAQQQTGKIYHIGFLSNGSGPAPYYEAFESSLATLGYHVGRNLVIERRYAAGDLGRLQALAGDLVRANVEVIVTDTTPATAAAKQATAHIPIIMASGGDAVGAGLVESLAHPGGNVTGFSTLVSQLDGKKPQLLRELKPDAKRLAFIGNSQIAAEQTGFREVQKAATALGMDAIFIEAPVPEAFEQAFESMKAAKIDAGIIPPSAPNVDARHEIVRIAARSRLPVVYGTRAFVDSGGLMSYGASRADLPLRLAFFVDKILKGANPADLPVEQPTDFELVINLKTATALGLVVPPTLLALAHAVIE